MGTELICWRCGEAFPRGRGRPRKWCWCCLPPEGRIGKARYNRLWRHLNQEAVERYNAERRSPRVRKNCTICGASFRTANDQLVHCPDHRRRHDEAAPDRSDRVRDYADEYRRWGR